MKLLCILLVTLLNPIQADLAQNWKIEGPREVVSKDSSSSSFRLEYTVSDKVRFARYKVFQKGCKDEFGKTEGEEDTNGVEAPVKGSGDVVGEEGKNYHAFSLSPDPSSSSDDQIASATFDILAASKKSAQPVSSYSISDLISKVTSYFSGQTTVEFCIRMGLWLPPEAGEIEVNFRETDVSVTLKADDHSVVKVELEDCPMNEIDVRIFGKSASEVAKEQSRPPKYEMKKGEIHTEQAPKEETIQRTEQVETDALDEQSSQPQAGDEL